MEKQTYKFKDKNIEDIFTEFYINKKSKKEIALKYNVSYNTIFDILKGLSYSKITKILIEKYKSTDFLSLPNEKWKDIVNYEGYYQISNFGRVKYLSRIDAAGKFWESRICKQHINMGYKAVRLNNPDLLLNQEIHVHRLIGDAFIPNINNKCCINHKNLNKLDNSLENLEWVTYQENTQHGIEHHAYDYLYLIF